MKTIYIAGKVTGLPFPKVKTKFKAAQKALEEMGFEVLNPIEIVNDPLCDWNVAMRICIANLMLADAIYMLPCCNNSPGAKLEIALAANVKIPVFKYMDEIDPLNPALLNSAQLKCPKCDSVDIDTDFSAFLFCNSCEGRF
jgi:hypothetical protein